MRLTLLGVNKEEKVAIVYLAGAMTQKSVRQLRAVIELLGTITIVLDVSCVTEVDSTAIGDLICANMHEGFQIKLAGPGSALKRNKHQHEMGWLVEEHDDVAAALASFTTTAPPK